MQPLNHGVNTPAVTLAMANHHHQQQAAANARLAAPFPGPNPFNLIYWHYPSPPVSPTAYFAAHQTPAPAMVNLRGLRWSVPSPLWHLFTFSLITTHTRSLAGSVQYIQIQSLYSHLSMSQQLHQHALFPAFISTPLRAFTITLVIINVQTYSFTFLK